MKNSDVSWIEELNSLIKKGCSDSDIEDFVESHPSVSGKDIWNYVYELNAPDKCKGCRHIQMSGMFPCTMCMRKVKLKDFYESR